MICEVVEGPPATSLDQNNQVGVFRAEGTKLRFTAQSDTYRIQDERFKIEWEVSNGGEGQDDAHDDIYWKGSDERQPKHRFERWVEYKGLHLLRVRLKVFRMGDPSKLQFAHTVVWRVFGSK